MEKILPGEKKKEVLLRHLTNIRLVSMKTRYFYSIRSNPKCYFYSSLHKCLIFQDTNSLPFWPHSYESFSHEAWKNAFIWSGELVNSQQWSWRTQISLYVRSHYPVWVRSTLCTCCSMFLANGAQRYFCSSVHTSVLITWSHVHIYDNTQKQTHTIYIFNGWMQTTGLMLRNFKEFTHVSDIHGEVVHTEMAGSDGE